MKSLESLGLILQKLKEKTLFSSQENDQPMKLYALFYIEEFRTIKVRIERKDFYRASLGLVVTPKIVNIQVLAHSINANILHLRNSESTVSSASLMPLIRLGHVIKTLKCSWFRLSHPGVPD
jgi:hypothetical protein